MEKRRQEKILCRSTWSFARDTHRSVKEPVDKRGQNDLVKKCVKRKGTNRALCVFFFFCNRTQALEILQQAYARCGLISCCQQHKVGLKPSMAITRYSHSVGTLRVISRRNSEGGWMKKGGLISGFVGLWFKSPCWRPCFDRLRSSHFVYSKALIVLFFCPKAMPFLLMTAIENQISGCCPLLFCMVKQTLDAWKITCPKTRRHSFKGNRAIPFVNHGLCSHRYSHKVGRMLDGFKTLLPERLTWHHFHPASLW